jgi:hypothetical protein
VQLMAMHLATTSQHRYLPAWAIAVRHDVRSPNHSGDMHLSRKDLGVYQAELAEDAATAAWEEGRRTRFEHAIALALDARGPDAERDM